MLANPAVLALNAVALTVTLLLAAAAGFALQVVRHWDIESGSERQLILERRTYLISMLVTWSFSAEVLSLLLFVYNAEQMSTQFVGAMCATGVLNANPWGWPTLFLKVAIFFAGVAWLTVNRMDNQAPDYPLVRYKYGLLIILVPLVAVEAATQLRFFLGLNPDVITSCCGSLFTPDGGGVAADVAALDPARSLLAMYASALLLLGIGLLYLKVQRGGTVFAAAGFLAFVVAVAAVVSAIALYVYEHPQHHCPFCLLKPGHQFIGYALYLPLFVGTALTLGVGMMRPWRRIPSLSAVIEADGRRFAILALVSFAVFYAVASWAVVSSPLRMRGVWW